VSWYSLSGASKASTKSSTGLLALRWESDDASVGSSDPAKVCRGVHLCFDGSTHLYFAAPVAVGARAAAGCFPRPAAAAGFGAAFPRPLPRPAAGGGKFVSSSESESTSEPELSSSSRSEQYSSSANSSSDSSGSSGWSPESTPSPSTGSVDPPAAAVSTCALVTSL
jgi:hypothetical protein